MSETQTSSSGMFSTAKDGVIPMPWPALRTLGPEDNWCSASHSRPSSKGSWWVAHAGSQGSATAHFPISQIYSLAHENLLYCISFYKEKKKKEGVRGFELV